MFRKAALHRCRIFCCESELFLFRIYLPLNFRMAGIMYVCLCNGITDRQLVEAAAELDLEPDPGNVSSFAEQVADRLGAGHGCGSCRDFAIGLVERAAAKQASFVLPEREPVSSGSGSLPARRGDSALRLSAERKDGALTSRGP